MRYTAACPACGAWRCQECGHVRRGASRLVEQSCNQPGCGSQNGWWQPTKHRSKAKYDDHVEMWEGAAGIALRDMLAGNTSENGLTPVSEMGETNDAGVDAGDGGDGSTGGGDVGFDRGGPPSLRPAPAENPEEWSSAELRRRSLDISDRWYPR